MTRQRAAIDLYCSPWTLSRDPRVDPGTAEIDEPNQDFARIAQQTSDAHCAHPLATEHLADVTEGIGRSQQVANDGTYRDPLFMHRHHAMVFLDSRGDGEQAWPAQRALPRDAGIFRVQRVRGLSRQGRSRA